MVGLSEVGWSNPKFLGISSFNLKFNEKLNWCLQKLTKLYPNCSPHLEGVTGMTPGQVASYEDNVEEVKSTPPVVQSVQTSVVSFNASRPPFFGLNTWCVNRPMWILISIDQHFLKHIHVLRIINLEHVLCSIRNWDIKFWIKKPVPSIFFIFCSTACRFAVAAPSPHGNWPNSWHGLWPWQRWIWPRKMTNLTDNDMVQWDIMEVYNGQ